MAPACQAQAFIGIAETGVLPQCLVRIGHVATKRQHLLRWHVHLPNDSSDPILQPLPLNVSFQDALILEQEDMPARRVLSRRWTSASKCEQTDKDEANPP